jgi:hypothetical protein
MNKTIVPSMVKRLAGLELNELLNSKVLPLDIFQGARVTSAGIPIYDINGEILFHRVPIRKGRVPIGYADVGVNYKLGAPLLSVNYGLEWNARYLLLEARKAAQKRRRGIRFNRLRFVAYSYPKIAVQFMKNDTEILMLELYTWKPVPKERVRKPKESPSNFERWSFLEELPTSRKRANIKRFEKRIKKWDDICPPIRPPKKFKPEMLRIREFQTLIEGLRIRPAISSRELHYSQENSDHHPCYELRGQLTGVWCVAASVQMLLDFYRYDYAQTRIAQDLNLGTLTTPTTLPYANDGDVVTVIENLTSNALDANMNTNPIWSEFVNEINANRPLISFIPGHSRTVAGYTFGASIFGGSSRWLLVYDPWPPSTTGQPTSGGTITQWENFDIQTYRRTFTAQLNLV